MAGGWPSRVYWSTTLPVILCDVLSLVRPFKSFLYWAHQFVVVTERIHQGDPLYLAQSHLEFFLLLATMVHFVGLIMWPPEGELDQILRFDMFRMLGLSRMITLESVGAVASTAYFHYFHCHKYYSHAFMYQWVRALMLGQHERLALLFGDGRLARRLLGNIMIFWKINCCFLVMAGNVRK